jgi:GNAT superfamily N-acetyltransferase
MKIGDYELKEGIGEKQINDLIWYSNNDEKILANTGDLERFKDRMTYGEWLKKSRTIYCLVSGEKLVGIVWFGKSGEGFTLAIRMYGEARGKGLSTGFLKTTIEMYKKTKEYVEAENKLIWLETGCSNCPAIKTYQNCGFKEVSRLEDRITFHLDSEFEKP